MYKQVNKQEFRNFLNDYPRELDYDVFMDYGSYHDFTIGKGFDSIVCRVNLIALEKECKYEIRELK